MRIGIVCYPTFGGSGVVASELGRELARRGHEVHFICYNLPARLLPRSDDVEFHLVDVVRYPLFEFPPYTLALASRILDVHRQHCLDVVHVHYAIPHSTAVYLAGQMSEDKGFRCVTTLHGTDVQLVGQDRSYREITRFSIERSCAVTAVSQHLADSTHTQLGVDKEIRVIHNFVDLDRFRPKEWRVMRDRFAAPEEKIICHISNFRPVKRPGDLIEVFRRVRREVPCRMILVGDGPERRELERRVGEERLSHVVEFADFTTNVEMLLGCSDVFLLPSEMESFGLSALEAMACQVPVVAYRVGGLPEVVLDGENGFLVPLGDTAAMARRTVELLSDDERRARIGQAARDRAGTVFSAQRIVPQYEALYEEVVADVPPRGARRRAAPGGGSSNAAGEQDA